MTTIKSYKDLLVWQYGMNLVEDIYRITKELPPAEQWGLTSQMRRAVVSVPSNIAEGFGRQATGEYCRYLAIARASLFELETHILICQRLDYFPAEVASRLHKEIERLSKMLATMIGKLRN